MKTTFEAWEREKRENKKRIKAYEAAVRKGMKQGLSKRWATIEARI